MITKTRKAIAASGATTENEPIIKSDGASSNVMQWLSNSEASNITISEDGSNNLDLVVSSGNVGLGESAPTNLLTLRPATQFEQAIKLQVGTTTVSGGYIGTGGESENLWITAGGEVTATASSADGFTARNNEGAGAGKAAAIRVGDGVGTIGFYTATGLTNGNTFTLDGGSETGLAMSISNAGVSTFNKDVKITSDENVYLSLDTTQPNGNEWHILNAVGGETSNLQFKNIEATKTPLVLDETGLTTVTAIVETGGVLKENLLTNSGFDVWSNSTLEVVATIEEDDCASDDTGDWTDYPSGAVVAFVAGSPGHYTLTYSGVGAEIYTTTPFTALTAGKLYKLSVTVADGTASGMACELRTMKAGGAVVDRSPAFNTTGSPATHTFVIESDGTEIMWSLRVNSSLGSNNIQIQNILLEEVTPGCVDNSNTLAFDGWYRDSTLDIWRQHNDGGTLTHDGSFYALKVTTSNTNRSLIWQNALSSKAEFYQRFAGRTVTLGAWVKTSTASHAFLRLEDSTGSTDSTTHTGGGGGGAWEWLEVTRPIAAATTLFQAHLRHALTTTDSYISQPMLVFGSAIGSSGYTRPSGEIIYCEKYIDSATLIKNGYSDVSTTALNLEADSNGKIPKGAKAVHAWLQVADSTTVADTDTRMCLSTSDDSRFGVDVYLGGLANVGDGCIRSAAGFVGCDSGGDIVYKINASGSGTFDVYGLRYQAVELR